MICVNMQTSFMHPPFGFALFYLRGISDTLYKNKALPRKVESSDIYMGAIPFIVIQLILVAVVIFFPQTVTLFLDKEKVLDLDKANTQLQQMGKGAAGASSSDSSAEDRMKSLMDDIKKDNEAAKKP